MKLKILKYFSCLLAANLVEEQTKTLQTDSIFEYY
jgi:hypothetical protein